MPMPSGLQAEFSRVIDEHNARTEMLLGAAFLRAIETGEAQEVRIKHPMGLGETVYEIPAGVSEMEFHRPGKYVSSLKAG
jgi:hypothetical protein